MNYELNNTQINKKSSTFKAIKKFLPLLRQEKKSLLIALVALLASTGFQLVAPLIAGHTIDAYIQTRQYSGVLLFSALLLLIYVGSGITSYIQTKTMGGVGQRLLFSLRNAIFIKLQELPVAFFNQNKAGDLISRINNDTDKLNQFFSQALLQFIGNLFMMTGAAIFIIVLNIRLGFTALLPAMVLVIFTQLISPWVKRKNAQNLQALGNMSAEIQESLDNFKVIVAFNRRDYFRQKFKEVNQKNYTSAIRAGIANNIFTPVYGLAANVAQMIVLFYGIHLIMQGEFTVGFLISYFVYLSRFYDPIRQIANLWATFQIALAGWERITNILELESDLKITPENNAHNSKTEQLPSLLSFKNISFRYPQGQDVLHKVNFTLKPGKTYAFVGPTGGGKTTTASLMARLYDPTEGTVLLENKDIRSYTAEERTKKIGFILQEPFLFTGTIRENILYGNEQYKTYSNQQLANLLTDLHLRHLRDLLDRFEKGLDTTVTAHGETISLGQRQLIAFIRTVIRKPDLLILDEATANIDTVTEKLLDDILSKLPVKTTKVIIAHRLNTIENADEIFFVNAGNITQAGSLKHAIAMLLQEKRES